MPERSNGLPWKGSVQETVPRVRIPLSPLRKLSIGHDPSALKEFDFCYGQNKHFRI